MGEYIGLVPPPEGFVQTPRFNFARYSEGDNYNQVNSDLIAEVLGRLPQQSITALDVAMGHGMVPRLLSAKLSGSSRQLHLFGVDLDAYAVEQARAQIPDTANAKFTFLQGDARDLKSLLKDHVKPGEVNYTSIHDAIHEITDDGLKGEILKSQSEMLAPEGLLSYNSAFTSVAVGREWAFLQIAFMERFGASKYRGEDVKKLPVHPPIFYRDLIIGAGLAPIHERIVDVPQYREELEAISEYPPFAVGFTQMMVFPRPITLEEGIDGIKKSITPVFTRFNTDFLSRKWHEIIAQKPA